MKLTIVLAAFATVFSFTPVSAATNLVVNGGFETGDFSGWDLLGDSSYTFVYDNSILPVADGNFSAAFGPGANLGTISQTIDTVPGGHYDVNFLLANTDTQANDTFFFSFDDGLQIQIGNLPTFDFSTFSLPVTASGLSADVTFFFQNPDGFFLLDDVSVTPAVPEPATWSMLLAGFATIGMAMRRRTLLTA